MPEYPTSEPVEAVLRSLGQALDLTNVGILLLNDDFHVRFANRRVTELFGFSSALLASTPKFRDLLDHVGASGLFAVADENSPNISTNGMGRSVKGPFRPPRLPYEMDGACCFAAPPAPMREGS